METLNEGYEETKQRIGIELTKALKSEWKVYLIRKNSDWMEVYLRSPKCKTKYGELYDVMYSSKGDKIFEKIGLSDEQKKIIIKVVKHFLGGGASDMAMRIEKKEYKISTPLKSKTLKESYFPY